MQVGYLRFPLLLFCVLLAACANKSLRRVEKFAKPLQRGDYLASIENVRSNFSLYGETNRVLWHVDLGILHHYAGQFDSSIVHFAAAETELDKLHERSLTNEAVAVLTNDNNRPYRSRPYERILIKQFQMLNYLLQGKTDAALVEVRSGYLLLDLLFSESDTRYHESGMFHYLAALAWEQGGEMDNAAISLYKSLRAYKNSPGGIPAQVREYAWFKLNKMERASDLQKLGIEAPKDNDLINQLEEKDSEVILLVYAGRGPTLDELKFWGTYVRDGILVYHYRDPTTKQTITQSLSAPVLPPSEVAKTGTTASGTTLSIAWSMPRLRTQPSQASRVVVRLDGKTWKSHTLDNTEQLLERNLADEKMAVLVRTVVRVALRTMLAQAGKNRAQTDNPLLNLAINLGTDVFSANLEQADLRLSIWMPRTFEVIRIPVSPGNHSFQVAVLNAQGSMVGEREFSNVQVRSGKKRFLTMAHLQ